MSNHSESFTETDENSISQNQLNSSTTNSDISQRNDRATGNDLGKSGDKSQENALLFSKAFNEARRREQRDLLEHLRNIGVEIIENDPYKTLSSALLAQRGTVNSVTGASESVSNSLENLESSVRTEELQKQFLHERERADRALSDLKEYKIEQELERVANKLSAVDQEDVATLFKAKYKVEHTNEGIRVYSSNGHLVNDAETAEPATLEYAMRKFLDDKPHLIRAVSRTGTSASSLIGSPKDLVERYKNGTPEEKRQVLERLKAHPNL